MKSKFQKLSQKISITAGKRTYKLAITHFDCQTLASLKIFNIWGQEHSAINMHKNHFLSATHCMLY